MLQILLVYCSNFRNTGSRVDIALFTRGQHPERATAVINRN